MTLGQKLCKIILRLLLWLIGVIIFAVGVLGGLSCLNIIDIPTVTAYQERKLLEVINERNSIVEESGIEMTSDTEGTATIIVTIPNYELLFKKAATIKNPDQYLLKELVLKRYEVQEFEAVVNVTVDNGNTIIHSNDVVHQLLEEALVNAFFNDETLLGYWNMVNDTEENSALSWSIDAASKIIGEYPDKQKYAEVLANLIMVQSGNIAEQVQMQSRHDDLKGGMDYVMDIIGIAVDFGGDAGLLESITPIIDAATGGAEVIIDSVEQAKYYETTIRDYSQSKMFLEAVCQYAENKELQEAASSLLVANGAVKKLL